VFDKVKSLVENADNTNIKTTVIVKGGPGTGKSVIALHLLLFLKTGKNITLCYRFQSLY
jgi:DNA helicase IV